MADQAGKDAKAQLKASKRAEKERKKDSTDPADMGRLRQIQRAYQLTHEYDKQLPLWVFGPWVGVFVIMLVIGFLVGHPIYLGVLGLTLGMLLASEVRKHERVAYGVKVTTIVMGDKEGQVPLDKLADHIKKLPKTLQANQVTDIRQRLRALDAVRPQLPMPKGPMPTSSRQVKGSRQAMRGR